MCGRHLNSELYRLSQLVDFSPVGQTTTGALFCEDRRHRYALWRRWHASKPLVNFLCFNPSRADELRNDPTIRRCMGFAQSWGYGGIIITNLYGFCTTDPWALDRADDADGPDNDDAIVACAGQAELVVAAWGSLFRTSKVRDKKIDAVTRLLASNDVLLYAIKISTKGEPMHPLYLAGNLQPVKYHGVPE